MFDQDSFMGLRMDPIVVLVISISITLKSCFTLHLKAIKTEKHYVPFLSSLLILFWGLFSSLRRILSLVCFFIPSLGLFSILYHYKAEQIPFHIWNRYNKTQDDKIVLRGLRETVLWGELDRWDYVTEPGGDGIPPHYSQYTGISLKWTFILFFILSFAQFTTTLLIKIYTSRTFCKREDYFNKLVHLILSLNLPTPFEDWDQGKFTINEYKVKHQQTNFEMGCCLFVNIFFSVIMLVPLWYTGVHYKMYNLSTCLKLIAYCKSLNLIYKLSFTTGCQVRSRHLFLKMLTGALPEENLSHDNIIFCITVSAVCMVFTSFMETLTYFLYNNKVYT